MYFQFESQIKHSSHMLSLDLPQNQQMHFEVFEGLLPKDALFIHGNLASNHWWYPYIEEIYLENLANKHSANTGNLYLAEFRGCGKSSPPLSDAEVNMKVFANDFIKLIHHLNPKNKLHLMGHSTGGNIAAIMLAKAPELFEKAILLDPVGPRGVVFDERMIETFERMKKNKALVSTILGMTIYQNQETPFFKEVIVQDGFQAVQAVGHLILKAFNGFNIEDLVRTISVPTQVLHGEFDQILSLEESKLMADLIPNGQFLKIPGQGHCLNLENPKLLKDYTEQFFFS